MSSGEPSLAALRREIDEIDDRVHDLLMRRGDVQAYVGAAKAGAGGTYIRPGREAMVLRRLLARHAGSFPKPVLVRIWREVFAAGLSLQSAFSVAVARDGGDALQTLAADHFGATTPTTGRADARAVLDAVGKGEAAVGVVPMPGHGADAAGGRDPWWAAVAGDADGPRVIARLPFAAAASRAATAEALVVGDAPPEDTGHDHSLIALGATGAGDELVRAAARADLHGATVVARAGTWSLLGCPGVIVPGDTRLDVLAAETGGAARVLGAYAVPLGPAELS